MDNLYDRNLLSLIKLYIIHLLIRNIRVVMKIAYVLHEINTALINCHLFSGEILTTPDKNACQSANVLQFI